MFIFGAHVIQLYFHAHVIQSIFGSHARDSIEYDHVLSFHIVSNRDHTHNSIFGSSELTIIAYALSDTHSMRTRIKPSVMETRSQRHVRMNRNKVATAAAAKKQQLKTSSTRHDVGQHGRKPPPRPFKRASLYYKARGSGSCGTSRKPTNKEDMFYEVEYVLDARMNKEGFAEYLVKWEGYHARENMWIKELPIFFQRDCLLLLHKALLRDKSGNDIVYESSEDSTDDESEFETDSDTDIESDDEVECTCKCHDA